jgi:NADPH-dependent 2,4-dienoyl-CoA reductase/sulfur reductase-like enzyme/rhodanese-related sulfurtransferase
MSAAARLRRLDEKSEIIVFERGRYISYASCGLPYYIGGKIKDRSDLFIQTPDSIKQRFNIDVRTLSEVLSIDRQKKTVHVKNLSSGSDYDESYEKLILSAGARPVLPDIPGISGPEVYTIRDIDDMDRIIEALKNPDQGRVIVIGGGYIGLEMAENLSMLGRDVIIIEKTGHILPMMDSEMALIVQDHLAARKIDILVNEEAEAISGAGPGSGGTIKIHLKSGRDISCGMVVAAIGVKPDVKIAKDANLEIGKNGGILVNAFLQTSDPDIYGIGDAIEVFNPVLGRNVLSPLAGPANRQGRLAADSIINGNIKTYRGTIGTAVVSVFGLGIAFTGASEKTLESDGIPHHSTIINSQSHADYYPGALPLALKVVFSPENGRILGAQAVGFEGADKRIDVISALIMKNGTVGDLADFEQAYSPQYSSAKDSLNMAGFTAENMLRSLVRPVYWNDIKYTASPDSPGRQDYFKLDVRTEDEFRRGSIPGAVNIPVDSLRVRLQEVPRDKKIAVFCRVGFRGYIAARILMQNGYKDVFNLSGGYLTYSTAAGSARG